MLASRQHRVLHTCDTRGAVCSSAGLQDVAESGACTNSQFLQNMSMFVEQLMNAARQALQDRMMRTERRMRTSPDTSRAMGSM